MTQSYTPRQIADGLLAGEFTRDSAFVPLAEVERLRAFNINAARETLEAVGEAADDAREEMRAKVVRLTRERDEAWSKETDYGEGFEEGWAAAQKHAAAEVERLQGLLEDISRDMVEAVVRLTRERDEARAEIERLREALALGSEVLASHQGALKREWHNVGAWLYAGDTINVVRAPLPEIEVES